jgi:YaiO family outer membrane protein
LLAPDDLDIRAALARAYLWSGDRPAAQGEVAAMEARSPGNADAAAIRQQLLPSQRPARESERKWGLAAAQSFSRVTFANRPSQTWADTSFAIFGNIGRTTALSVGVEREDRRTATDTRFEARIDQQLRPSLRTYVAVAATPNANFREKWGVTGGVEADVASFATLLADLRHAEYQDASVTVFQPGIRITVRKLGLNATVRMINLWDEDGTHRSGLSGRLDRPFSSGATLFAGAATYPDTEAGITRQVHSLFAGGTMPLTQKVLLRAGIDYDRRRATYTRKGASLGIQVRF